jgi:hypothetical protein
MAAERPNVDVPWYLVVLVGLVVICSAILSTAGIGGAHAALELPAVLTFALPPILHLATVLATWENVRSADPRRQRASKQAILAIAAILMLVGALTTHLRLGQVDVFAVVITGFVSGAGPLTLALIFFPPPRTTGEEPDVGQVPS